MEKQFSLSQGRNIGTRQLKILSLKDIKKATNNLDPNLLVGSNTHQSAYKATIEDHNLVIGVSLQSEPNPQLIDCILTEAATMMVLNHDS